MKLLKCKLPFSIEQEISQQLETTYVTWAIVSIEQIHTAMKQIYMRREPQVCSLIKLFSQDRLKKSELSCTSYFAKFMESLPPCLVCKTNDEYKDFYDLVIRSAYYLGLDNNYLQNELSKLSESDQTFQKFYEESCA